MQVTAQRSPVASAFVFLITFSVVYSLSYFAIGMVLLISAATATIAYFRRNAAGAVLAAFFLLPMYWVFGGYPQTGTVPLLEFLSLALLTITLILAGTDWLAGLVGIWLGLLLAVPSWTILIIPAIASLALLRGRGPAILATSIFCFFGVFYLFAIQWGYLELAAPLQGGSTFFPALGALSANPMFANLFGSLLGPSWATNLSGSWVGQLFTYIPLYFVLIATVLVLAINYSLRLTRHMPFHLLASVVIASVMAGIAGLFVTGDTTNLVGAGVLTFNIAVLSVGGAPLLGPRPRFTTTGLAQLIAPPAVVEAQDFERKEGMQGIIVQDKPTPKTADYWEKAKGMDELKEELIRSVALPMQNKEQARKYDIKPAKGILLFGPPGTGKTTTLRGLSAVLRMRYVEVNPGEIMSKWYGESEQNIKKVFDDAIEKPPTILAIDEIDAIGRNRGDQSGDSVTPRLLNLILMGMDKVSQGDAEVVVVGTTNKPEILDKALLRPGRFDKVIYVGPPDEKARAEIFRGYLQRREVVSGEIDYDKLAKMSERFTGADIEALVNKVFQRAFYSKVKEKKGETVTEMTLEEAIKSTRPTIGFSMLEEYERFRAEYQRERRIQKGWESEVPDVKFDEIGGLEEAKDSLRETIELPLKHPDLMEKLKVKPVRGVLLYGPPGNGKTLLAKAVATEIEANFFVVSGADLAKGNAGDAASRIKELFNIAKDNTPAVIFIDEVDQIAPDRSNPMGAMFVPVTTQLLAELDGVKSLQGVMVLAATNRPSEIDPALLRSNRLEKHIEVPNPNVESRRSILNVCLRGVGVADGVSVDELAQLTADFSGAKLQEFVNEAKKAVLRRAIKGEQDSSIRMEDFANALRAVKKVGD